MEHKALFRWDRDRQGLPRVPVLVHAMRGSLDAGFAGALVVDHLLEAAEVTRLVTFDVDELLDYRSRRPAMTFERTAWIAYAEPVLALDHLRWPDGGELVLLHGTEPDLRWERFVGDVMGIAEALGVTVTVGLHGIPMGVPHTRPVSVTAHGTDPALLPDLPAVFGTAQVPGSASTLLEYRLGQAGRDALGFAAHVPHYLAQTEFPAAAAELVRRLSGVFETVIDDAPLEEAATRVREEIDRQVADSDDVAAIVAALELQYDSAVTVVNAPMASEPVPTVDELAAQVEAFLAEQSGSTGDAPPEAPAT